MDVNLPSTPTSSMSSPTTPVDVAVPPNIIPYNSSCGLSLAGGPPPVPLAYFCLALYDNLTFLNFALAVSTVYSLSLLRLKLRKKMCVHV